MSWIRSAIARNNDPRSIVGMCELVIGRWIRRKIVVLPYELKAATRRLHQEHHPGGSGLAGYHGMMFCISSVRDSGHTTDIIYRIPERMFTTKKQRTDRRAAMAEAVKIIAKSKCKDRYEYRYYI